MTLFDTTAHLQKVKKAILATNFYNLETLQAILMAAKYCEVPVILQLTRSSIEYMGLTQAVTLARESLASYGVKGWIHLDHGDSVELVERCLDAGFDSVMIDASHLSFAENVKITEIVVKKATNYGALVEAELGYIAKLGQEQSGGFTTVDEAVSFVNETGVDALAIAVGSAHGFYKSAPRLNMERIAEIHAAIGTFLVLHGSSGIPNEMIQMAIRNGITKINLATEIKDTFMRTLRSILQSTDEIDLRKVFPNAQKAVVELLTKKYRLVNFM